MNGTRMACVAALVLATGAHAEDSRSPRAFLQAWADAWHDSDVDRMMAFYDTSEETTAIESLGHVRKGPAEIRKMYRGAFDELIFDRVTLTSVTQGRNGDTAWATCRYKADIRLEGADEKFVLEVLGSFVMRKANDSWKITLEHFSTIPDVPRVRPAE